LQQRQGEAAKDRDRRAAGIIFRDSLGMCFHSSVFKLAKHVDTVLLLPVYSNQKIHLPWKRWLDIAAKEALCIIDWVNGILPPGPDFDIKKLGAGELRDIAGSYVDSVLNSGDDYDAFSVIRWTAGVSDYYHRNTIILMFYQNNVPFPTLIRKKGLFPLF